MMLASMMSVRLLGSLGLLGACGLCAVSCTETATVAEDEFEMIATTATQQVDEPDDDGAADGGTVGDDDDGGQPTTCGNNVIDGADVCDGVDLGGQTCMGLGFQQGALTCSANCKGLVLDGCGWFECGNGEREGDEDCDGTVGAATCADVGFDNGTLFCTTDCEYDSAMCGICGDEFLDPGEDCEAGMPLDTSCQDLNFDSGTVACGRDCLFDSTDCQTCGNNAAEGSESCDGADLKGATCAGLGLEGGQISCAQSCSFDLSGCDIAGLPFGSDDFYTGLSLDAGVLACDDISGTGLDLNLGDDSSATVGIGFDFAFYGVMYSQVRVQSNGTINFGGASTPGYTNSCLPGAGSGANNVLLPFWDDLDPSADFSAAVRTQTLGLAGTQRMIVEWDTPFYASANSGDHVVIRVALYEGSNAIDVCYVDTQGGAGSGGNNGQSATSGIQLDALTNIQFSCNAPELTDGLQLTYLPI